MTTPEPGSALIGTFGPGTTRWVVGDRVTATRHLRQDGTFPDPRVAVGQVLVEEGTAGQVVDVGVHLNEHIVYAVAFDSGRLVGCLERELAAVQEQVTPS
ncbi:MAG TPA: nitrogen fixation protein NifZ [Kineosporiaceae bacterium]